MLRLLLKKKGSNTLIRTQVLGGPRSGSTLDERTRLVRKSASRLLSVVNVAKGGKRREDRGAPSFFHFSHFSFFSYSSFLFLKIFSIFLLCAFIFLFWQFFIFCSFFQNFDVFFHFQIFFFQISYFQSFFFNFLSLRFFHIFPFSHFFHFFKLGRGCYPPKTSNKFGVWEEVTTPLPLPPQNPNPPPQTRVGGSMAELMWTPHAAAETTNQQHIRATNPQDDVARLKRHPQSAQTQHGPQRSSAPSTRPADSANIEGF